MKNSKSSNISKALDVLGVGVNLGNTFDAFDRINHTEIDDETAWGQPKVTQEYMNALKNHGFKSIRIPFTAFTRIGPDYKITESFLQRFDLAVDYALNAGLYVMINLHHDSSEWLNGWNGDLGSELYLRFIALWKQLATRFQDYDEMLIFESINEPFFDKDVAPSDDQQNDMLRKLNLGFRDVVRSFSGNNATRLIVFPTLYTNDSPQYSDYLARYIGDTGDPNILATVHWYASTNTYAFTSNIGVQFFDEEVKGISARQSTEDMFTNLHNAFISKGIGVIIGEFGLFNQGIPGGLNDGEVYKYKEYVITRSRELGICPMLWDVGLILNRHNGEWVNKIWGEIVTASMSSRSSYATGLDHSFINEDKPGGDITIPLTLNGNTPVAVYNGSYKLLLDVDYSFTNNAVTIQYGYLSSFIQGKYGTFVELLFEFSAGARWHHYFNYVGKPSLENIDIPVREDNGYLSSYDTDNTPTYPVFIIPGTFAGELIRRIESLNEQGQPQSANTWASDYMQFGGEFKPVVNAAAFNRDILALMNWYNNAIDDGKNFTLVIDFFDDTQIKYLFTRSNGRVTGKQIA